MVDFRGVGVACIAIVYSVVSFSITARINHRIALTGTPGAGVVGAVRAVAVTLRGFVGGGTLSIGASAWVVSRSGHRTRFARHGDGAAIWRGDDCRRAGQGYGRQADQQAGNGDCFEHINFLSESDLRVSQSSGGNLQISKTNSVILYSGSAARLYLQSMDFWREFFYMNL